MLLGLALLLEELCPLFVKFIEGNMISLKENYLIQHYRKIFNIGMAVSIDSLNILFIINNKKEQSTLR